MKTAQLDSFVRDLLPPPAQWPEYRFDRPELQFSPALNAVEQLLDQAVSSKGYANNLMLRSSALDLTYQQAQAVINRIAAHDNLGAADKLRALAHSFFISADMAHAYHPNFSGSYDAHHHVLDNKGVVIKSNCNHRYASNADTTARFMQICNQATVPYQQYVHRTDLGCGSTIGPIIAAQLGVATVDVGCPMWAMHSIRESAGVLDHHYMICALTQVFNG